MVWDVTDVTLTATVAVVLGIVVSAGVSAVGETEVGAAEVVAAVLVSMMILSEGSGFFGNLRTCADMPMTSTAAVPSARAAVRRIII